MYKLHAKRHFASRPFLTPRALTRRGGVLPPWPMEGEYQGRVKDGKLHGVGVCLYTDGSRYQGDWKAGLKSGRGTHSFASGDQFEGEWENGWMHGLGVYTWKIGDKYIGEVRAALRRLSGPAEDSCPSLACAQAHVAHSLWLLGASAAYPRAAARHVPA